MNTVCWTAVLSGGTWDAILRTQSIRELPGAPRRAAWTGCCAELGQQRELQPSETAAVTRWLSFPRGLSHLSGELVRVRKDAAVNPKGRRRWPGGLRGWRPDKALKAPRLLPPFYRGKNRGRRQSGAGGRMPRGRWLQSGGRAQTQQWATLSTAVTTRAVYCPGSAPFCLLTFGKANCWASAFARKSRRTPDLLA